MVQMCLQSFGITQDPALSAQALVFSLSWLLVLGFHDVSWLPWDYFHLRLTYLEKEAQS